MWTCREFDLLLLDRMRLLRELVPLPVLYGPAEHLAVELANRESITSLARLLPGTESPRAAQSTTRDQ